MYKLIRNTLSQYCVLKWDKVGLVKWEHIEKLNDLQKTHGGHKLGNKISDSHIYFHKKKMNVCKIGSSSNSIAESGSISHFVPPS